MLTSYTEQINAISSARELLKKMNICGKAMDEALNDAASTIAALNLTKKIEKDNAVEVAMMISEDVFTTIEKLYS